MVQILTIIDQILYKNRDFMIENRDFCDRSHAPEAQFFPAVGVRYVTYGVGLN